MSLVARASYERKDRAGMSHQIGLSLRAFPFSPLRSVTLAASSGDKRRKGQTCRDSFR